VRQTVEVTQLDHAEVHNIAAQRVAADGQRYTDGRRQLVDMLIAAGDPQTIADLLARDTNLAQSSVYRNLAVLEKAGVLRRVIGGDEFGRYELAEDLSSHHHHLVCTNCGSVQDVEFDHDFEHILHENVDRFASQFGFAVDTHRLDLMGVCRNCSTAS
jgi:Fe2+ or Zn2+ uptake regulation protein